jgi:hypothetical protein
VSGAGNGAVKLHVRPLRGVEIAMLNCARAARGHD